LRMSRLGLDRTRPPLAGAGEAFAKGGRGAGAAGSSLAAGGFSKMPARHKPLKLQKRRKIY
jgi:hypothetical protein